MDRGVLIQDLAFWMSQILQQQSLLAPPAALFNNILRCTDLGTKEQIYQNVFFSLISFG